MMLVSEIITLGSTLGAGLDQPTEATRAVYLKYLNEAHAELYEFVSKVNLSAFLKSVDLTMDNPVIESVLFVRSVHLENGRNDLKRAFYQDIVKEDPFLSKKGDPLYWYAQEEGDKWTIGLYPSLVVDDPSTVNVRAYYVAQSVPLSEEDDNNIPYPKNLHSALVDGLMYYLIQGEQGFNNSVDLKIYADRWDKRKARILANYQMTKSEMLSTFSEV